MAYGFFQAMRMRDAEDNWGFRSLAARENRAYETFGSADGDGEEEDEDREEAEELLEQIAADAAPVTGPSCPERFALWQKTAMAPMLPFGAPGTYGVIVAALRAHSAECAACGCSKKEVMTDRELLDANAVCCEIREAA